MGAKILKFDTAGDGRIVAVFKFQESDLNWDFASNTDHLPVAVGLEFTWTPPNVIGFTYNMTEDPQIDCTASADCEGQIPGSPMNYLSTFGKLELLGIPQIFYEKITCNSNQEKVFPNLYVDDNDNDIVTSTTDTLSGHTNKFTDIANRIQVADYRPIDMWYSTEDTQGIATAYQKDVVYKTNIKKPDIFSENQFQCCLKLGDDASSADQCCSGHAVYKDGDPEKGMTCKLPFGTNLNVYFNRFVSSDGLLEDSTLRGDSNPIGFLQNQFNPYTGEVIPSADTDEILVALGEKYCTADLNNGPNPSNTPAVRRGGAVGNFRAGPALFHLGDEFQSDGSSSGDGATDYRFRRLSFVDNVKDFEGIDNDPSITHPRGYFAYLNGNRWNHHFYCTGVSQ